MKQSHLVYCLFCVVSLFMTQSTPTTNKHRNLFICVTWFCIICGSSCNNATTTKSQCECDMLEYRRCSCIKTEVGEKTVEWLIFSSFFFWLLHMFLDTTHTQIKIHNSKWEFCFCWDQRLSVKQRKTDAEK